jgi:hypothetical protein
MRSSWSINDFPEDGDKPSTPLPAPVPTRKLSEAERFALIRNRKDRKGRGSRRRNGEKRWATKGK